MAQRKRVGLITQRSLDRDKQVLSLSTDPLHRFSCCWCIQSAPLYHACGAKHSRCTTTSLCGSACRLTKAKLTQSQVPTKSIQGGRYHGRTSKYLRPNDRGYSNQICHQRVAFPRISIATAVAAGRGSHLRSSRFTQGFK